jgi:predicted RecA/RadA family phage recombinase
MAKNFIQPGEVVTVAAPTGGVASGAGVLTGSLFGVTAYGAVEGADVEVATCGVWDLPKAASVTPGVGAKVYWDNTNKNVTTTASGNSLIGVATKAALAGDATVRVRLDGTSI